MMISFLILNIDLTSFFKWINICLHFAQLLVYFSREGSRTDDEVVRREEEAIKLDGLSVAEIKEMRSKAEKHQFQAEVNRMMKLIINSLYRNKEVFLRELISNASDALDKIRLLSLSDKSVLNSSEELSIKIKTDKENHSISVTDTGIGKYHRALG